MADRDDVCVLIPTYNEAATIGSVVESFVDEGFDDVLVIDGGSEDDTREIAEDAGARVVTQTGDGKGQAVREAIHDHVEREVVLMLDGDGTYPAADAEAMLEPIFEGEADHVIGNRFSDMESGAMSRLNRVGNGLINRAFIVVHGTNLVDILSGYRAFTTETARRMELSEDGFGIETEMAVECVRQGVDTEVVPITYRARPAGSDTNLSPFRDGGVILLTLYRLAKTHNPLFYFGSIGVGGTAVGVLIAAYVGVEWFIREPPVSHDILAIVAAFFILFGVQLLIFGVLSDMIVSLHREQMRRIEDAVEED